MKVNQLIKNLLKVDASGNLLALPSSEDGKQHLNKKVVFKWKIDRPLLDTIDEVAFSEAWGDDDYDTWEFHTLFFEFECTNNYGALNDYTMELKLTDLSTSGSQLMENGLKELVEEKQE